MDADEPISEEDVYLRLSPWAVGSLLLGILSFLAMTAAPLVILPFLTVGVALVALVQTRAGNGVYLGRKLAMAGAFLGVMFVVATGVNAFAIRRSLEQEARVFADAWFDFLRQGKLPQALQLTRDVHLRRTFNRQLEDYYAGAEHHPDLVAFASNPGVLKLIVTGEAAQARYYETEELSHTSQGDHLVVIYAITLPESPRKSYFMRLEMLREENHAPLADKWQIDRFYFTPPPESAQATS